MGAAEEGDKVWDKQEGGDNGFIVTSSSCSFRAHADTKDDRDVNEIFFLFFFFKRVFLASN